MIVTRGVDGTKERARERMSPCIHTHTYRESQRHTHTDARPQRYTQGHTCVHAHIYVRVYMYERDTFRVYLTSPSVLIQ